MQNNLQTINDGVRRTLRSGGNYETYRTITNSKSESFVYIPVRCNYMKNDYLTKNQYDSKRNKEKILDQRITDVIHSNIMNIEIWIKGKQ